MSSQWWRRPMYFTFKESTADLTWNILFDCHITDNHSLLSVMQSAQEGVWYQKIFSCYFFYWLWCQSLLITRTIAAHSGLFLTSLLHLKLSSHYAMISSNIFLGWQCYVWRERKSWVQILGRSFYSLYCAFPPYNNGAQPSISFSI